jgi:hypothetical protein
MRTIAALSAFPAVGFLVLGGVQACASKDATQVGFDTPVAFDADKPATVRAPDASTGPSFGSAGDAAVGAEAGIVGEGCGGGEVIPQRTAVYFSFVLDGSLSMADDNKWKAQVSAMNLVAEDFANKTAAQLAAGAKADSPVGLIIFSDSLNGRPNTTGPYPKPGVDLLLRPITSLADAVDFSRRLDGTPAGGTPTLPALQGAYPSLAAYAPQANVQANGKRVVVLMSDGEPDNNTGPQIISLAAAQTTASPPIFTYAVGVGHGGSYKPEFMAQLAIAGKTAPSGCDPALQSNPNCFFQVDPSGGKTPGQITSEMVTAINSIRTQAASCDLALTLVDKDGKPADPKRIEVTFTDPMGKEVAITKDPVDGWSYDNETNPTRLLFKGKACATLNGPSAPRAKVKFGCQSRGG